MSRLTLAHTRAAHLLGNAVSAGRVELANLAQRSVGLCHVERNRRHARLDEAGAHGIHANAATAVLPRRRLRQRDHGRLAGRIVGRTGARTQARDRGRHDDAAARVGLARARLLHGCRGKLARVEAAVREGAECVSGCVEGSEGMSETMRSLSGSLEALRGSAL